MVKTIKTLQKKTKKMEKILNPKKKNNKMKSKKGFKEKNIILGLIKKDLNRQVKLKIKTIYPRDLLNIIDLITLDKNYKIVGSYSYRKFKISK